MIYTFPCGCEFDVFINNDVAKLNNFDIDKQTKKYPNCPVAWTTICKGKIKGLFQLDSKLGKEWSQKVAPQSIEELSALVALVRPGCLEAMLGNKNMTQHYVDRKHGKDEVKYLHEQLEPILKNTYGIICFQESILKIASELAGFSLVDSDSLRRSIGKKKPELMKQMKDMFLQKAKDCGKIPTEVAEQLIDWIEKSQRYLFVRAHAVGYGVESYWTAYLKGHFPQQFYTAWLQNSDLIGLDRQDEVAEMIQEARVEGISVFPPSINKLNKDFKIINNDIYYGFINLKGLGESGFNKFEQVYKTYNPLDWIQFLLYVSTETSSTVIESIIKSGALDKYKIPRKKMLYEFSIVNDIKKNKEYIKYLQECYSSSLIKVNFTDLLHQLKLKKGVNKLTKSKLDDFIKLLNNPVENLNDTSVAKIKFEKEILGIALTTFSIDDYNRSIDSPAKTCLEIKNGVDVVPKQQYNLLAELIFRKDHQTKKGDPMAFLSLQDDTDIIDAVVFKEGILCFDNLLEEERVLIFTGTVSNFRNDRGNGNSFIVSAVKPAEPI